MNVFGTWYKRNRTTLLKFSTMYEGAGHFANCTNFLFVNTWGNLTFRETIPYNVTKFSIHDMTTFSWSFREMIQAILYNRVCNKNSSLQWFSVCLYTSLWNLEHEILKNFEIFSVSQDSKNSWKFLTESK